MFLKFRVKAAIAKFITMKGLNAQTLQFFESGPIDTFFHVVEERGLDANEGAVAIISMTITQGVENGALSALRQHFPQIYSDLKSLWSMCGALLAQDERRWQHAVIVGNIRSNPFETIENS